MANVGKSCRIRPRIGFKLSKTCQSHFRWTSAIGRNLVGSRELGCRRRVSTSLVKQENPSRRDSTDLQLTQSAGGSYEEPDEILEIVVFGLNHSIVRMSMSKKVRRRLWPGLTPSRNSLSIGERIHPAVEAPVNSIRRWPCRSKQSRSEFFLNDNDVREKTLHLGRPACSWRSFFRLRIRPAVPFVVEPSVLESTARGVFLLGWF